MKVEVKIPEVGESVNTAVIGQWQKSNKDYVERDEALVLLETDKASVEVPSPASGQLEILKKEKEELNVGAVIAVIDTSISKPKGSSKPEQKDAGQNTDEKTSAKPASKAQSPKQNTNLPPSGSPIKDSSQAVAAAQPFSKPSFDPSRFSPAVRHKMMEKQMDPSIIQGTGKGGRIKKSDLLSKPASSAGDFQNLKNPSDQPETRSEKMTTIRKRIAERLVASQHSTATLSTFNEADMSQIIKLRKEYKEIFQKKFGIKLGFMGFFIKALVQALKTYPRVNAQIEGDEVVYYNHCHISIAVSTEKGLIVPVIRYADQMSLAELEKAVLHFAEKTRTGQITPDDLMGGTFTISNGGVFGSLLSTPILNPPQSGILGMHKIEQRPVAVEGQVVIRPMMYLALSYDHRIVDGRESVGFLVKVKECIEEPARLLLDV